MPLVRSGLGEDFDPSVPELVVFSGKRVLVDANFANGSLRRKLAGGEAVDINLPAIWPSGRSGESLQVRLQIIRIVRERLEVFSLKHNRAGVVSGICIQGGSGLIRDRNLLFANL